jgi:peptidoglycan/xylan/chitin deacetylase (PgdA/CDA1 family)/GT2 family glycosyltransferase
MKISVVIPSYNRRELLAQVLPTVFDQDLPSEQREVVVVVDGSTDGTAEHLRGLDASCRFTVLEQPNRGPASARNAGVRAATGEIVLFLDDDIRCESDLLTKHVAAHARYKLSVIFGPVFVASESPQNATTILCRNWYRRYAERLTQEGGPWSKYEVWVYSNCSINRELFLANGGYDESFQWAACEDADIAIRLWNAGVTFRFEPKAPVHQLYDKSPARIVRVDAAQHARAEVMLCRKHPSARRHSRLAQLNQSWLTEFLTFVTWQSPASPELLLRAPFHLAASLSRIPPFRRTAVRLLRWRVSVEAARAGIREIGGWREMRRQFAVKLPVLLYHDVGYAALGIHPEQTVSPQMFENQVKWLAARGYTGIGLSDWLAWRREGRPLPERPLLFSFDDGYAGVAKHALPVLERYGFKASVFVVTDRIGKTNAWDEAIGIQSRSLMTADEIRHWAARGFEFGSHSRTHRDLTALASSELRDEVAGSKDDLAAILGSKPTAFAYPYGRINDAVQRCVSASFSAALSTFRGTNTIATDPYQIRRSRVSPRDSMLDLACRIRFGTCPIVKLRSYLPTPLGFRPPAPRAVA